jgi:thioredoxin-like negative regulator of GroEL
MNLATVRLRSRDAKIVADAERTLENLRTNAPCRLPALRSLVNLFLERKQFDQARILSKELQADPGADVSDQILRLRVLQESKDPELGAYVKAVQQNAAKSSKNVYDLAAWMTANGFSDQALLWLQTLPDPLRTEQPVPLAIAEVYAAKARWPELDGLLRKQNWGTHDFLRLAMLARALRAEGEKEAAEVNWHKAVRLASEHAEPLSMLSQMADAWGWKSEAEEVLWLVANRFPDQRWALQSLYHFYLAKDDTRRMRDVYAAIVKQNPADAVAKNNLAAVSFLLNSDIDRAHRLAEEIHKKDPKDSNFTSTYAYSLHLRGKTRDGLKLLQALGEPELQKPSIALYYGLMLMAEGDAANARKYLALAAKARLLPEERELLLAAKQGG